MNQSSPLPFLKMHGLGNDFVVFDRRESAIAVTPELVRGVADRRRGIGCDQVVALEAGETVRLTFWNADGSPSATCGNATRCLARHLMEAEGTERITLATERGRLTAERRGAETAVNMGPPLLDWREIPLAREVDVERLPIPGEPVATSMGNPHCTFFVEDADAMDLKIFGPAHEHHELFPERTNVQVAHLVGPDHLRMRVWERGAGITPASGSSSCATAVAAARRGLTGRSVRIDLDGGPLRVEWRDDGVWMTGPTAHVANGVLRPAWLEGLS